MNDLTIRRADADDIARVAPLFDAYRSFSGLAGVFGRAVALLRERDSRGESALLLAERDGGVLGFTHLYPLFSSVRTARVWLLNDLFVADAARRQGVARALLDAASAFARERGAAGLMLETGRDNEPARALYRAAGWTEDETQWYSLPL
jgi:GNAT superfamily N-acetyltransferase